MKGNLSNPLNPAPSISPSYLDEEVLSKTIEEWECDEAYCEARGDMAGALEITKSRVEQLRSPLLEALIIIAGSKIRWSR